MANKGVYSREDNSPESVGRSVQDLSHRNTMDCRYMEIYPNFAEYIYPNETFRIKTTNFLRTIPMVAPMLSRVRIVQRFYAVPIRLMWQPWEKYIDISNEDFDFTLEEPYVVNSTGGDVGVTISNGSASGGRQFQLTTAGYVPSNLSKPGSDVGVESTLYVQTHDLLDYLSAPLNVELAPVDSEHSTGNDIRFSAYKCCAYQLSYSFGYRMPNVQKRIDDYYQMYANGAGEFKPASYVAYRAGSSGNFTFMSVPESLASASISDVNKAFLKSAHIGRSNNSAMVDLAQSSTSEDILRTSWDKCELFPLKAGANASMQAWHLNSNGSMEFVPSNISLTRKRFANWSMDYFTSCNPWQQRGLEANIPVSGSVSVTLPDSTTVTLSGLSVSIPASRLTNEGALSFSGNTYAADSLGVVFGGYPLNGIGDGSNSSHRDIQLINGESAVAGELAGDHYLHVPENSGTVSGTASASFSSATAVTNTSLYVSPSNFRFAMALQHVKEMSARTDGRYKHFLSKFFGAFVHDDRIDYPEFLGGFVQDLNIDTVTQTSESGSTDLGTLAGNGISAKSGYTITYHAKEHTVLIGLLHIIPDTEYVGGLNREDNTADPYDWMLPQFSGLSEQPVFNYELSATNSGDSGDNNAVFGYQPYLNYLRGRQNRACGAFRDSLNTSGSYEYYKPWIIQRDFGAQFDATTGKIVNKLPSLSDAFLSGRGTVDNSAFTVADDSMMYPFMCDSYFKVRATRTIPRRGIPRL